MEKRKIENTDISSAKTIVLPPAEQAKADADREKRINLEKQEAVDKYNADLLVIDESFSKKKFIGAKLVVKLVKDDYIVRNTGSVFKDGLKKINDVAFQKASGDWTTVENPLPFLMKGVICVVPELVRTQYLEHNGVDLVPGLVVELSEFNLSAARYYLDKSKIDIKGSEEEMLRGDVMFPNHAGYFTISVYDIESIV